MNPGWLSRFVILVLYFGFNCGTSADDAEDDMVEHVLVFKAKKVAQTDLECLQCYSGDETDDCMDLKNISNIPTRTCREGESFCKVQRIHTNGVLTTFDRYCARVCEPGCRDAAIYLECVSCCNHESLCNTDNGASHQRYSPVSIYGLAFVLTSLTASCLDLY